MGWDFQSARVPVLARSARAGRLCFIVLGSGRLLAWGGVCLQAVEIGDGLLRLGGGGENGAGVGLHHANPVVDIAGVIGMRLAVDAEARANEARSGLDQLS